MADEKESGFGGPSGNPFDMDRQTASLGEAFSPALRPLAIEKIQVYRELLERYGALTEAAEEGKPITAKDIAEAEAPFNKALPLLEQKLIKQIRAELQPKTPGGKGVPTADQENKAILDFKIAVSEQVEALILEDKAGCAFDTEPLNKAFEEQVVKTAPGKHLAVDAGVKDETALALDLLKRNPGLAVADAHVRDEASLFIADRMKEFKAAGVDTIYIESPEKDFNLVASLSLPELRDVIKTREYKGQSLRTPEQFAADYNFKNSDDSVIAHMTMIAEAREYGVRIVNIDKKGDVRNAESLVLGSDHRLATTNFSWTDAIKTDREELRQQGHSDGKFIVWGGAHHFTGKHEGMVDDALGLPVIGFTRADKQTGPVFLKGWSANGPDFFLRGGGDYPGAIGLTAIQDTHHALEKLDALSWIPKVEHFLGAAQEMLDKAEAKIYDRADNAPLEIKMPKLPSRTLPESKGPGK